MMELIITAVKLDPQVYNLKRPPIEQIKQALDIDGGSRTEAKALWGILNGTLIIQSDIPPRWNKFPGFQSAKGCVYGRPEQGATESITCLFEGAVADRERVAKNKIPIGPERAPWWFAHRLRGAEVLTLNCVPVRGRGGLFRASGRVKVIDPDLWLETRTVGIGRKKALGFGLIHDPDLAR